MKVAAPSPSSTRSRGSCASPGRRALGRPGSGRRSLRSARDATAGGRGHRASARQHTSPRSRGRRRLRLALRSRPGRRSSANPRAARFDARAGGERLAGALGHLARGDGQPRARGHGLGLVRGGRAPADPRADSPLRGHPSAQAAEAEGSSACAGCGAVVRGSVWRRGVAGAGGCAGTAARRRVRLRTRARGAGRGALARPVWHGVWPRRGAR